ncbi:MAG: hypothetical protein SGPRY_002247 [Prymnesium sp.]
MSGQETPRARRGTQGRPSPRSSAPEQPSVEECRAQLIEPNRALVKIKDGRYLVPVDVGTNDEGRVTVGLASAPTVASDADEVVWVEATQESTMPDRQGISWIIREVFGHTFAFGGARWVVTGTGGPSATGVRDFTLEREGGRGPARSRVTHRYVPDVLRDISFDESRLGVFEARELEQRHGAEDTGAQAAPPVQLAQMPLLK